jgi:hypothetical protein
MYQCDAVRDVFRQPEADAEEGGHEREDVQREGKLILERAQGRIL